ncbi:GTPase [uncultured Helicobacter sp.]|uniref:YcjF family protein n=1 Tax=uncultured Helicobacter sp. TaxID=175537 RepID=UPI00263660E5|nr:GTPase [uncultured Helicobacter sp.]
MQTNHTTQQPEIDLNKIYGEAQNIYQEMTKEKPNLNLFIIGATGVGKSTLINAIFGKKIAKAGSGTPITQEIQEYKIKDKFSIFDSKGLERKDYEKTLKNIKNFLETRNEQGINAQIHIALLCIQESTRRIEESEKEMLKILQEHRIPTIVVITKAQQDKDENGEKFSEIVARELKIDDAHLQRIWALAVEDDEGYIKPLKGINEMIDKVYALLGEGRKEAFARHQTYDKDKKKQSAQSLLSKYTAAAATMAATPIPFSDFALLAPTQMAMIGHISSVYDIELTKENLAKIVGAFTAVAGVGYAVKIAVGSLIKLIPAVGTLAGGTLNATMAATTTGLMGKAWIAYLDSNFDNLTDSINHLNQSKLEENYKNLKEVKEKNEVVI